jgi:Ca2+ transporting ATPase
MSVLVRRSEPGSYRVYAKGAIRLMLEKCTKILRGDGSVEALSEAEKKEMDRNVISEIANNGLRTLLFAYRDITDQPNFE